MKLAVKGGLCLVFQLPAFTFDSFIFATPGLTPDELG